MKGKHTNPYSPKVKAAAKGSYLGKTKDRCGASANKPGKSGNCYEGKKA